MRQVNKVLKKYELKPHRYEKSGKATFVDTERGRFVVKPKNKDNEAIFRYLDSRSFVYYPKIVSDRDDEYEITEYEENFEMPEEQKILDLTDLISLLHNKTTHFKEVDEADYKTIFEDISNNIEYLYSDYNDRMNIIESRIYMSPSEYLLARNISKIYAALAYAKKELEHWYELVQNERKKRLVVIHNNLELSHFIRNKNAYLTSWGKARIDMPVFDLYKLYLKHSLDFDFSEILKRYEKNYPFSEAERKLLFILIALPDKLELTDREYDNCKRIGNMIDRLYKTEILLSPYYEKEEKHR